MQSDRHALVLHLLGVGQALALDGGGDVGEGGGVAEAGGIVIIIIGVIIGGGVMIITITTIPFTTIIITIAHPHNNLLNTAHRLPKPPTLHPQLTLLPPTIHKPTPLIPPPHHPHLLQLRCLLRVGQPDGDVGLVELVASGRLLVVLLLGCGGGDYGGLDLVLYLVAEFH